MSKAKNTRPGRRGASKRNQKARASCRAAPAALPDTAPLHYKGLNFCDECGHKLEPHNRPWGLCDGCRTPRANKRRAVRDGKPRITPKAALIAGEALLGGHGSLNAAARAIGVLDPGGDLSTCTRERVKAAIEEILERAGVSREFIASRVRKLMDAKTTKFFAFQGKVKSRRTIDDNETQRYMTVEAAKMQGMYPKETEQASEGPAKMEIVFQQVQGADGKQGQGMTVRIGGSEEEG